jgi:hypothetical protein
MIAGYERRMLSPPCFRPLRQRQLKSFRHGAISARCITLKLLPHIDAMPLSLSRYYADASFRFLSRCQLLS